MQLFLETTGNAWRWDETVTVRVVAFNDGYTPVTLDRRLLVGPNPVPEQPSCLPFPISVEPEATDERDNLLLLNAKCLYGRQRTFARLPEGKVSFYAYLLVRPADRLLPQGPVEPDALELAAEPLELLILPPGDQ